MRKCLTGQEARRFLEHGRSSRDFLIKRVLLYTGIRVGECAALQAKDVDLEGAQVHVGKTVMQVTHFGKVNPITKTKKNPDGYPHYSDDKVVQLMDDDQKVYKATGKEIAELVSTGVLKGEVIRMGVKSKEFGRVAPLVDPETLEMLRLYVNALEPEDWLWESAKGSRLTKGAMQLMIVKHMKAVGIPVERARSHALRHTYAVQWIKGGGDLRTLQLNLGHSNIQTTAIYLSMTAGDRVETAKKVDLGY